MRRSKRSKLKDKSINEAGKKTQLQSEEQNDGDRIANRRVTGSARRGEHVQNLPLEEVLTSPKRFRLVFSSKKSSKQGIDANAPEFHTDDQSTLETHSDNHQQDHPTSNSEDHEASPDAHHENHIGNTQKTRQRRIRHSFEPVLSGEALGGPTNPEILISFEAHIAFDIYQGKDTRGCMRIHQRPVQHGRWNPPTCSVETPRWWKLVEASGLSHLRSAVHTKINFPLINAFIERWQPETNSFHLPFAEMTITLHDVWEILRLQINGEPVVDEKGMQNRRRQSEKEKLAKDLGLDYDELKTEMSRGSIKFETLRRAGTHLSLSKPEMGASAYLLHLICSTVFIDKSHDRAQHKFFNILRDMDRVPKMAWGAATLAYLYRKLGEASRGDCKQMAGCITLLQSWIYEHFPQFPPPLNHSYQVGRDVRSMRWNVATITEKDDNELISIRMALDDLKPDEVNWMPYGPLDFDGVHQTSLYHGCLSCLDISEPYMPDRVARQFGRVQCVPMEVITPLEARRPRDVSSYKVTYPDSRWAWRTQKDQLHRIPIDKLGPPVVAHYDCDATYMSWFVPRTHVKVSCPSSPALINQGMGPRPRPAIADQRIQQTIPILRQVMDPKFNIPKECRELINLAYQNLTYMSPEDFRSQNATVNEEVGNEREDDDVEDDGEDEDEDNQEEEDDDEEDEDEDEEDEDEEDDEVEYDGEDN